MPHTKTPFWFYRGLRIGQPAKGSCGSIFATRPPATCPHSQRCRDEWAHRCTGFQKMLRAHKRHPLCAAQPDRIRPPFLTTCGEAPPPSQPGRLSGFKLRCSLGGREGGREPKTTPALTVERPKKSSTASWPRGHGCPHGGPEIKGEKCPLEGQETQNVAEAPRRKGQMGGGRLCASGWVHVHPGLPLGPKPPPAAPEAVQSQLWTLPHLLHAQMPHARVCVCTHTEGSQFPCLLEGAGKRATDPWPQGLPVGNSHITHLSGPSLDRAIYMLICHAQPSQSREITALHTTHLAWLQT